VKGDSWWKGDGDRVDETTATMYTAVNVAVGSGEQCIMGTQSIITNPVNSLVSIQAVQTLMQY
jgi:hypothetical protein